MKLLLHSIFRFSPADRAALAAVVPGLEIVDAAGAELDACDGRDVTILVTEQLPRDLAAWPALRWVQLISAGSNQLLGHPLTHTDIPVTNASGTHGVPIAQYVTTAVLMAAHRMPEILAVKSTRTWPNRTALASRPLRGATAGLLGYGSIGRESARQLAALGLRIVCLKHNPAAHADHDFNAWPGTGDPEGSLPEKWYGPKDLEEFIRACDYVVVNVPSTPQTAGMIGARELGWSKPSAHWIIVSRGGIVSESALAAALRAGTIGGATVDCFVREPLPPEHEFFATPNLLLTPHMSGVYEGFWPVFNALLAENLRRFAAGAPLLNRVQHARGY